VSADTPFAQDLVAALGAVRRAGRRHDARPAELSALTGAQLELARLVRRNPGISIAAAAERLRLAPNTISTLVGELTSAGVLRRGIDPGDRRVARLELPPRLTRKIDAWRDRRTTAIATALGRLPEGERRTLERALPALTHLADELEALGSRT